MGRFVNLEFDSDSEERSRHVEKPLLELRELLVKMTKTSLSFAGRLWLGHPNLPVTYASVRSSRGLVNI